MLFLAMGMSQASMPIKKCECKRLTKKEKALYRQPIEG